jgi:hypothetical protein
VVSNTVRGGAAVSARAATAFTDAFNVASIVCIGIALAAAATVLWFSRRTRPDAEAVVDDLDLELGLELGLVPVGVAEGTE